jgi:hypothetical protein
VRSDRLDRSRDGSDRDREDHKVGPINGRRGILEDPLHAPQRFRLRAVIRVMVNASDLACQAASTTGKPQAAADQAKADDRDAAKERDAS